MMCFHCMSLTAPVRLIDHGLDAEDLLYLMGDVFNRCQTAENRNELVLKIQDWLEIKQACFDET